MCFSRSGGLNWIEWRANRFSCEDNECTRLDRYRCLKALLNRSTIRSRFQFSPGHSIFSVLSPRRSFHCSCCLPFVRDQLGSGRGVVRLVLSLLRDASKCTPWRREDAYVRRYRMPYFIFLRIRRSVEDGRIWIASSFVFRNNAIRKFDVPPKIDLGRTRISEGVILSAIRSRIRPYCVSQMEQRRVRKIEMVILFARIFGLSIEAATNRCSVF